MLSLVVMEKGDYICVNQYVHSDYECFDTEVLMREHWLKCLKIPLSDEYNMLVLPNFTKDPAKKVKLPVVVASGQKKRGRTGGNTVYGNPDYGNPEKTVVEVSSVSDGEHDVSTLTKNTEID